MDLNLLLILLLFTELFYRFREYKDVDKLFDASKVSC